MADRDWTLLKAYAALKRTKDTLEKILDDDDDLLLSSEYIDEGEPIMKTKPLRLFDDEVAIEELTAQMCQDIAELTGKHAKAVRGLIAIVEKQTDPAKRRTTIKNLFQEPDLKQETFFAPFMGSMRPENEFIGTYAINGAPLENPQANVVSPEFIAIFETMGDRVFKIFNQWRLERSEILAKQKIRTRKLEIARRRLERLEKAA
jgi:hypothetical protein